MPHGIICYKYAFSCWLFIANHPQHQEAAGPRYMRNAGYRPLLTHLWLGTSSQGMYSRSSISKQR